MPLRGNVLQVEESTPWISPAQNGTVPSYFFTGALAYREIRLQAGMAIHEFACSSV